MAGTKSGGANGGRAAKAGGAAKAAPSKTKAPEQAAQAEANPEAPEQAVQAEANPEVAEQAVQTEVNPEVAKDAESGVLVVTGPRQGRRRADRAFGPEAVRIPLAELSDDDYSAIVSDPLLACRREDEPA